MPRYYFHIRDKEHFVRDEEGQECPDMEAVEWEARQSAREIIASRLTRGVELDGDVIEVHDNDGATVHCVKLADLIS